MEALGRNLHYPVWYKEQSVLCGPGQVNYRCQAWKQRMKMAMIHLRKSGLGLRAGADGGKGRG